MVGAADSTGSDVAFGIAISTIGRTGALRTMLDSLAAQSSQDFVVAVCAQGAEEAIREVCADVAATTGMTIHVVTSAGGGVSAGRNAADRGMPEEVGHLLFPNDTTVYPPDFLAGLGTALQGAPAAAVVVHDLEGPKTVLPPEGFPLDRADVWAALAPGLVVRRDVFRALGGFEETLGTGAPTPWQSGEETDLLLRFLDKYDGAGFRWLTGLSVSGPSDGQGQHRSARRRKLRAYGRGYGRVIARHGYPWRRRARGVLGGALFGVRHRHFTALDGGWVVIGRLEGMAGRTLGRPHLPFLSHAG